MQKNKFTIMWEYLEAHPEGKPMHDIDAYAGEQGCWPGKLEDFGRIKHASHKKPCLMIPTIVFRYPADKYPDEHDPGYFPDELLEVVNKDFFGKEIPLYRLADGAKVPKAIQPSGLEFPDTDGLKWLDECFYNKKRK
jgi:hypothetical protein